MHKCAFLAFFVCVEREREKENLTFIKICSVAIFQKVNIESLNARVVRVISLKAIK